MKWITTFELSRFLVAHPDKEYECQLYIGSGLVSTHWLSFNSQSMKLVNSQGVDDNAISPQVFLKYYNNCKWRIKQ